MTRQVLLLNSDKPEVNDILARRPDVRVRVITRKVYADLYHGLDVAYVDGFDDLTQVERAAYELTAGGPVDHVIAATEKSVVPAGLVRSLLGVPGLGFDQSLWAAHKRAMKDRLRDAGLPVTPHAQAASLDEVERAAGVTGWPVIVKPVFGAAAKATYRVDSPADLAARHRAGEFADLAARRLPVQVERLVRFSDEYHCDGVVHRGEVARAAVSRYLVSPMRIPKDLNSGCLIDQSTPFARAVLDLHRRVVAVLGLTAGVTHLEAFRTDDGPVIGEVAVRPGGLGISRSWWHAFGVDLWEEFVRVSLDEEPTRPDRPARREIVGRTQLPVFPGLRERAAALPRVIEVRTPEESGTGYLEAHYTAPDETAAGELNTRLQALAVPGA
ncbi:hypothetical protein AB0M32_19045 [Streptomyces sp. NPDC051985]|uniref:ATP-grasp domain-containing protein n=1 Tax=Streptomyces sp. NPDC051985 TaxID=3155807 RepID=UPI003435729A